MTNDLNINNVFFTFQGEGQHAGRRALFVRMPFCDLACKWCDTTFDTFKKWSQAEFLKFALEEECKFAVITGGEPMLNKHTPKVIELLKTIGYEIACESNGNYPIVSGIDFATVSPKREQKHLPPYHIHPEAFLHASEFKYVVDKEFDFSILNRHNTNDGRRYSLSPEFNNMAESMEKIMAYIKENPSWRISLQTHKWINIP